MDSTSGWWHRGQQVRSSWEGHRREVAAPTQAPRPVRFCSFRCAAACRASPRRSRGFAGAVYFPRGASSPVDDRICSASCLNGRTANAANSRANTAARADGGTDQQRPAVQVVGLSATVASYVAPTATDVGSGPGDFRARACYPRT